MSALRKIKIRKIKKRWRFFLIWISLLVFSGCSETADDKVVEFVKNAKSQKTGQIEPLPQFPVPAAVKYTAARARDPFEPYTVASAKEEVHQQSALPDLKRPREPLEAYPLDSLKMVGTLEREGEYFALIKDSSGILYRVTVGNYIGQNSGKIEKINEKSMEVKELLADGKGGWKEHGVTLHLVTSG